MQPDLLNEVPSRADPQVIADVGVGVMSFVALSTYWMNWLDVVIKVIIGLLTIALLLQRFVSHRRKKDQ